MFTVFRKNSKNSIGICETEKQNYYIFCRADIKNIKFLLESKRF